MQLHETAMLVRDSATEKVTSMIDIFWFSSAEFRSGCPHINPLTDDQFSHQGWPVVFADSNTEPNLFRDRVARPHWPEGWALGNLFLLDAQWF